MRRRSVRLLTFTALICAASSLAASDLFGPRSFSLSNGSPQTFNETVAVTELDRCDGRAAFTIVIENGSDDPGSRVTSGSVTLNDVPVVDESDFQAHVPRIERPVRLIAANRITVRLNGGRPGAFIKVSIRREAEEDAAPSVTDTLNGGRQQFTHSFTLANAGNYALTVQNGSADGKHRVRTGSIVLNGVEVFGEKDLNARVELLRRVVSIQSGASITVDASGQAGDFVVVGIERLLDESVCSLGINVVSPAEGSTVSSSDLLVRGTATGPVDAGISVNGLAATVDAGHAGNSNDPFLWSLSVPAAPGAMTLTARITTTRGSTREAIAHVVFAPPEEFVTLTALPTSGVAPFSPHFELSLNTKAAATRYEFDLDGDGTYETSAATLPETLTVTYAAPGTPRAAARVTLEDGRVLVDDEQVVVQSFVAMDAMLRATWTRFADALARGDVDGALAMLSTDAAREKYRRPLLLIRDNLPRYAAGIREIYAKSINGPIAHYRIVRDEDGHRMAYHLYFVRCHDGVWRVSQF